MVQAPVDAATQIRLRRVQKPMKRPSKTEYSLQIAPACWFSEAVQIDKPRRQVEYASLNETPKGRNTCLRALLMRSGTET
jgi:hypothetical protein